MTTRLYYTDQSAVAFDAVVQTCEQVGGQMQVRLDRSLFYPTSGGQPHDVGTLADATVMDVFETEQGDVVHIVDRGLAPGASVHGRIDWARRFDHMQQHTGQHVLSAAFDRVCGVRTVSFHMGATAATIDLARDVSAGECEAAETDANRVIWEDRAVTVRFATADEAARLPLRKEPVRTGMLRLVEVDAFDMSACGGTHVARTGMIGVVAIAHVERFKGASRVTFVCGGRALASHRSLRDAVAGATRVLSVPVDELAGAVERTAADARDTTRAVRRLQEELARYRAEEIRAAAETIGPYRVVIRAEPELDAAALKGLASAVVSQSGTIVAMTGRGSPTAVVIACGPEVGVSAAALLSDLLGAVGGRGGGSATLAQGGTPAPADAFLSGVKTRLQAMVPAPTGRTE